MSGLASPSCEPVAERNGRTFLGWTPKKAKMAATPRPANLAESGAWDQASGKLLACHLGTPCKTKNGKLAARPTTVRKFSRALNAAAVCPFVASKILIWNEEIKSDIIQLDTHERNKINHTRRSPALARAERPVAKSTAKRSRLTFAGHSSAFPDTSRDFTCATPATRGVRKNFAGNVPWNFTEPCGPVHLGRISQQNSNSKATVQHSAIRSMPGAERAYATTAPRSSRCARGTSFIHNHRSLGDRGRQGRRPPICTVDGNRRDLGTTDRSNCHQTRRQVLAASRLEANVRIKGHRLRVAVRMRRRFE